MADEGANNVMYEKGYVQGTFDMFHIGHLLLIERAKKRCRYLIVGVVTDELNKVYKGRKPVISYEDRADIVKAIRYVDEVIKVDIGSDNKLKIQEKTGFDCHFCGDDHQELHELRKELQKQGADVVLFPYTQRVSTTMLRQQMGKPAEESV